MADTFKNTDGWHDSFGEEGVLMAGQQYGQVNHGGRGNHWKYPETIGNDTGIDDINFNSNQSSEYAKKRMNAIDPMTGEPFILFEFMRVDNDDYGEGTQNFMGNMTDKLQEKMLKLRGHGEDDQIIDYTGLSDEGGAGGSGNVQEKSLVDKGIAKANAVMDSVKEFAGKIGSLVNRKYVGSVAMYMPTDIQINDQMVYNEDSRKVGAFMQTLFSENYEDIFNPTTLTSTTAMTAGGWVVGKIPFLGKMLGGQFSALVGAISTSSWDRITKRYWQNC